MQIPDEQVKDILELRERITLQIEKYQEEIEYLQKNLKILDSLLKNTSFTKASSLRETNGDQPSSIPITKGTDGDVIANAHILTDKVSIIIADNVELKEDIPPFKTFFIDRILGEMKKRDVVDVEGGRLDKNLIIDYEIKYRGPNIHEIIIKNYRNQERLKEIINTAGWSFSRMLENSK